ncbi:F-box protein At5g49610-like [Impatiens glandulifera]|uniref:F-box protein At5g49610-like n=1 Tax=Impatiens glandulifera TaxID=253017 RepID=UPI001FB0D039|nr:F-box protein At5g49610-like [Impatiens glandulifera]XP_047312115.1 F-box protein At5g49610-like [Impatiens glandulifera]
MERQLSEDDDDDDNSYVIVDFENFPKIFSDSDKISYASDNSSGEVQVTEPSSDTDTDTSNGCWEFNNDVEEEQLCPFETNICLQEPDNLSCPYEVDEKNRELKDIVKFEVLPLLPAKLLLKFRSVSKDWDRWISSPFLAHQQSYLHRDLSGFFRQSGQDEDDNPTSITFIAFDDKSSCSGIPKPLEFLPESISLITSNHGLLLCRGNGWENEGAYYVCNPLTKQYRELPKSNYLHCQESAILVFEPSVLNFAAEYQVVAAHSMMDQPFVLFEIYSSKDNTWRCSETICLELEENVEFVECFYMKGHVYWQTTSRSILAFDLKTEHCGVMSLPMAVGLKKGVLTELQGEFSYVQIESRRSSDAIVINIYQGWDFGVMKTLKLPIARNAMTAGIIDRDDCCRLLQSVEGEILILLCEDRVYGYHLKEKEIVLMNKNVGNKWEAKYLTYVNSLVTVDP